MASRRLSRQTLDGADDPQAVLVQGAARLGLPLDDATIARLLRYQSLLLQWGDRINLTAVRNPGDVVIRHFLDSLALLRELPQKPALCGGTLVDVGSGAGFPGVLCALFRPELRVTLVERVGKKAAFLLTLRRELALDYEVEARSAELLSGGYDIAVSRAALPLSDWLKLGARLIGQTGWVFAMTTPREPVPAEAGLAGLFLHRDVVYDVGAGSRTLLCFRRLAPPAP
jgi:16S rRNA (guanine527-N7)-methyltransferase